MMRVIRWVFGLGVVAALGVVVLVPVASAAEVHLLASLHGSTAYPRATGHSDYERHSGGRHVEVTVNNLVRLAGKRLSVFVAGQTIGTMLVSSTGRGHIERDTEHGQFVPVASAGDRVRVRTAGGTLVAGGRYLRQAHD